MFLPLLCRVAALDTFFLPFVSSLNFAHLPALFVMASLVFLTACIIDEAMPTAAAYIRIAWAMGCLSYFRFVTIISPEAFNASKSVNTPFSIASATYFCNTVSNAFPPPTMPCSIWLSRFSVKSTFYHCKLFIVFQFIIIFIFPIHTPVLTLHAHFSALVLYQWDAV